jgi:nucleotide-binding universal stress UspA family protein
MPKIKRVLVPIDFPKPSLAALRHAADLAKTLSARLELLHVVDAVVYAPMMGPPIDLDRLREQHERAARDQLERLQAELRKKRLRCRIEVRVGAPASAIVDIARRRSTDLIVMATQGRRGVGRWLLGSVAQRVVRTATCPVLTLRSLQSKSSERSRERRLNIRRILVPTDFSEISDRGVKYAADFARSLGAELILFHAVEPILMAGDLLGTVAAAQALDQMERSARENLLRSAARLKQRGIRCRAVLANGDAAAAIVGAAAKARADLVAMSTHGRSGVSHLFLGSVAERVVQTAGCPVLTMPSRQSPPQAKKPSRMPTEKRASR